MRGLRKQLSCRFTFPILRMKNTKKKFSKTRCQRKNDQCYLCVLPVGNAGRNLPLLLFFHCHLRRGETMRKGFEISFRQVSESKQSQIVKSRMLVFLTFLLGECITGAGGDGGPRGIFLLILLESQNKHCEFISRFSCSFWYGVSNIQNILETWGFHGIFLHFHHTDDPLFGTGIKRESLLGGCVPLWNIQKCDDS